MVSDPEGLSALDQCSVVVNGDAPVVVSGGSSGMDLAGEWRSLIRSFKRSFTTVSGKIRVKNLGTQEAPGSMLHVYKSLDLTFDDTDLYIGKAAVSSIPAGGYVDVRLNLKLPYDKSRVCLIGVLDAANALVETNEKNNMVVSDLLQ